MTLAPIASMARSSPSDSELSESGAFDRSDEPDLAADFRAQRHPDGWGRPLRAYRSLASTNDTARKWARNGAPEGALVYAEAQTAGRGRQGRSWEARSGRNLLVSLILRPPIARKRYGLIPVAAALGIANSCRETAGESEVAIKWPNDVLLDGKKCCGTLLETAGDALILGIGLNVNQTEFPEELRGRASSLRLRTGRTFDRADLLAQLLDRIQNRVETLFEGEIEPVRRAYEAEMWSLGESIRLRTTRSETWVEGNVRGIDETGGLHLETPDGTRVLRAGEVTRTSIRPRRSTS